MSKKKTRDGKWVPDPFYLTTAWKAVRDHVLARDNYLCRRCWSRGRLVAGNVVHHIKPRETHSELALDPENLVTWCDSCHAQHHRLQEAEKRREELARKRRAKIIKG